MLNLLLFLQTFTWNYFQSIFLFTLFMDCFNYFSLMTFSDYLDYFKIRKFHLIFLILRNQISEIDFNHLIIFIFFLFIVWWRSPYKYITILQITILNDDVLNNLFSMALLSFICHCSFKFNCSFFFLFFRWIIKCRCVTRSLNGGLFITA